MAAEEGSWAFIQDLPIHDLQQRLAPVLSSLDTQFTIKHHIFGRLRTEQDEEEGARILLNLISVHVSAHVSVVEELLELLTTCSQWHVLYIDCIAKMVETPQESALVLPRYRELVMSDRRLLLPVIGSLGDFPLSDAQKRVVLEMTLEALAVVEEEDMPAIVRTLLASITKGPNLAIENLVYCLAHFGTLDSVRTVISEIRAATADFKEMRHASLILEIMLNALRLHPNVAKHLLSQISGSSTRISRLDLLLMLGLIERPQHRTQVQQAIITTATSGLLTLDLMRTTLSDQHNIFSLLPAVISLLRCLLYSASATPQLLEWALQLYTLFFVTYERYSTEALSSLLSVFASTSSASPTSQPQREALSAARVLLALTTSQPALLVPYIHLFEEVLYDSAPTMHIELLHPLCYLLAMLSTYKDGMQNSLMIVVNKMLFAGARTQQRAGLVLASHLMKQHHASPASSAEHLLDLIVRVLPSAESHPITLLHLLDVILYNIASIAPHMQRYILHSALLPLLAKARVVVGVPELVDITSFDGIKERREASLTTGHLAQQSMRMLGSTAAHLHPAYHSLLMHTVLALHASLHPHQASSLCTRLISIPIDAGPLCEMLCTVCATPTAHRNQTLREVFADDIDEGTTFIAECAWASHHSYALLVTLTSLLLEQGACPPALLAAAGLRALDYRSALLASVAALTRRWQSASHSSALSSHAGVFRLLASFGDDLLPLPLLFALLTSLDTNSAAASSSDPATLRRAYAVSDLTAILITRISVAFSSHSFVATPTPPRPSAAAPQTDWLFVRASAASAISRLFLQDLMGHCTQLRFLERIAKRAPLCAELRKAIARASGTPREEHLQQLYSTHLRLTVNELFIVFLVLEASTTSETQIQLIRSLMASPPTQSNDEVRQSLYASCLPLLGSVEDQGSVVLLLQILVSLTRGTRKARDVGVLYHSMLYFTAFLISAPANCVSHCHLFRCFLHLSRVFPTSDSATLSDVLPLYFDVPGSLAPKSKLALRLRKGQTPRDFSSSLVRHFILSEVALMRGQSLTMSLNEIAVSALELLESALPHHDRMRSLDECTLPSAIMALFEVSSVLIDRAVPTLDAALESPYVQLIDAIRGQSRALAVFAAAVSARRTSASLAAHVSSVLANTLPAMQRQLLECTKWRSLCPVKDSALTHLLDIALLSTPFASAHRCVRLARNACQLIKSSTNGKTATNLPRAIQRIEALYCFLENTARIHHIANAAKEDKEFAPVVKTQAICTNDDVSDNSTMAMWQQETNRNADSGGVAHTESSSVPEDTATAGEEDLSDEDISDEGGGFRLVKQKRKAMVDAPTPVNAKSMRAEREDSEEEDEKPYIIVVKPKPRGGKPAVGKH